MNIQQLIADFISLTSNPAWQTIVNTVQSQLGPEEATYVQSQILPYVQSNPGAASSEVVTVVAGRIFHNARKPLGWMGWLVDLAEHNTTEVAKLQFYVQSQLAAMISAGTIAQAANGGLSIPAPKSGSEQDAVPKDPATP